MPGARPWKYHYLQIWLESCYGWIYKCFYCMKFAKSLPTWKCMTTLWEIQSFIERGLHPMTTGNEHHYLNLVFFRFYVLKREIPPINLERQCLINNVAQFVFSLHFNAVEICSQITHSLHDWPSNVRSDTLMTILSWYNHTVVGFYKAQACWHLTSIWIMKLRSARRF